MLPYEIPKLLPQVPEVPKLDIASLPTLPTPNVELPKLPELPYIDQAPPKVYKPFTPTQVEPKVEEEVEPIEEESYYSNPSDPEEVNSVIDVISNAFDSSDNGGKIFSLSTLWDGTKQLWDKTVTQPFKHKDTKAALLNNLVSLGETVDVLSNVVKAALPTKWTTGSKYGNMTVGQRIKSATGIGVKGRYSYDIDLKKGIMVDMIAECLVDPLTWVTAGTSSIAKNTSKNIAKKAITGASSFGPASIKSSIFKAISGDTKTLNKFAKQVAEDFITKDTATASTNFASKLRKLLRTEATKEEGILSIGLKDLINKTDNKTLEKWGKELFDYAEHVATHKVNLSVINTVPIIDKASKVANKVDRNILFVAGLPIATPIYLAARYGALPATRYVLGVFQQAYRPYQVTHKMTDLGINIARANELNDAIRKNVKELKAAGAPINLEDTQKITEQALTNSIASQVQTIIDTVHGVEGWEELDKFRNKISKDTKYENLDDAKKFKKTTDLREALTGENTKTFIGIRENVQAVISDMTQGQCNTLQEYLTKYAELLYQHPYLRNTDVENKLTELLNLEFYLDELIRLADVEKVEVNLMSVSGALRGKARSIFEDDPNAVSKWRMPSTEVICKQCKTTYVKIYNEAYTVYRQVLKTDGEIAELFIKPILDEVKQLILQGQFGATYISNLKAAEIWEGVNKLRYITAFGTDLIRLNDIKAIKTLQLDSLNPACLLIQNGVVQRPEIWGLYKDAVKYIFDKYIMDESAVKDVASRYAIQEQLAKFENARMLLDADEFGEEDVLRNLLDMAEALEDVAKGLKKENSQMESIDLFRQLMTTRDIAIMEKVSGLFQKLTDTSNGLAKSVYTDAFKGLYDKPVRNDLIDDVINILDGPLTDLIKQADELSDIPDLLEKLRNVDDPRLLLNQLEDIQNRLSKFGSLFENLEGSEKLFDTNIKYGRNLFSQDKLETKNAYSVAGELSRASKDIDATIRRYKKIYDGGEESLVQIRTERFMQTIGITCSDLPNKLNEMLKSDTIKKYREVLKDFNDPEHTTIRVIFDELEQLNGYLEKQRNFMNNVSIAFGEMSDKKFVAFMETFQNFGNSEFDILNESYVIDSFIQKMKQNLSPAYRTEQTSLDGFRRRMSNPWNKDYEANMQWMREVLGSDELVTRAIKQGHLDPGSDVLITRLKFLKDDPEAYRRVIEWEKRTNSRAFYFDIETVNRNRTDIDTLNKHTGQISQIALMGFTDNEPIVFRLKGLNYEGVVPSKVVEIDGTSDQALLDFIDGYLKTHRAGKLIGANSYNFDVPFIRKRWNKETYYKSRFADIVERSRGHMDLTDEFLKAAGVPVITYEDSKTISKLLNMYRDTFAEYHYHNVQSLQPYQIINNIKHLQECFKATPWRPVLSDSDTEKTIGTIVDDLYNLIGNYRDACGYTERVSYQDLLVRNLWDEKLTDSKIRELGQLISKYSSNPAQDLAALNNLNFDAYASEIAQAQLKEQWIWYKLYDAIGDKTRFNIDTFKQSILEASGRNEINNLQEFLRAIEPNQRLNYVHIIKDDVRKVFTVPETAGLSTTVRRRMVRVQQAIERLVQYRIKNSDAIWSIPNSGFRDHDSLIQCIKDLKAAYGPTDWAYYIDLEAEAFQTDEALFAIWYILEGDALRIIRGAENADTLMAKQSIAQKPIITEIREQAKDLVMNSKVLKDEEYAEAMDAVHSAVFCTRTEDAMKESLRTAFPLTHLEAAASVSDLFADMCRKLEYIPNAGAREFAARQRSIKMKSLFEEILALPKMTRDQTYQVWRKAFAEANRLDVHEFFKKAFSGDVEATATFLISDILFHNPYKLIARIAEPATDFERYYASQVEKLISMQDELAKYGLLMDQGEESKYVILYLDASPKARRSPVYDWNKGTAKWNGREWYIADADYEKSFLRSDNPNLQKQLDVFNDAIQYNANNARHATFERLLGSSDRYAFAYNQFAIDLRQSISKIYLPQDLGEEFFEHNPYDTSKLLMDEYDNPIISVLNSFSYFINSQKLRDLFIDMYTNPQHGLNFSADGIFATMGIPDEKLYKWLPKQIEFIPCMLVADNSFQGFHLQQISIYNQATLDWARANNVVLMPYQVFSNSFDVINNVEEALYKAPKNFDRAAYDALDEEAQTAFVEARIKNRPLHWFREVMYLYKMGYLISFGTFGRNAIDSIVKAFIDTEDLKGTLANTYKANKLLVDYNNTLKEMRKLDENMPLSTTGFKSYFQTARKLNRATPMSEEDFLYTHGFVTNGPSAGESKIISDWANTKHNKKYGKDFQVSSPYDMIKQGGRALLTPMGVVESRARMAQYLALIDQGLTRTQAFARVSRTAFDYNVKSNFDKMMELLIPFYTFRKLNLNFWLYELSKKPSTARYIDAYWDALYNGYDITADDYNKAQEMQSSLVYHLLNGNIPLTDLNFGEDVMDENGNILSKESAQAVLKVNPSFMDVFNLIVDPKTQILQSTFAPLQNFIKYASEVWNMEQTREQLLSGEYIMKYGKFYGHPVKELLDPQHRAYAQWLLTNPDFIRYNKPVYDYLMYQEIYKDPVMPFGKFKGYLVSEVPDWYWGYMEKNSDFYNFVLEAYPYIDVIRLGQQDIVTPAEDVDNDTILSYEEIEGALASGLFMDKVKAASHIANICKKTATDPSTYPIFGVLDQRYLGLTSSATAKNNYQRLKAADHETLAKVAFVLPDIFGATIRYKKFVENEALDERPSVESKKTTYSYPRRSSRYYYPYLPPHRYRASLAYKKFTHNRIQRAKLRYNINYLGT